MKVTILELESFTDFNDDMIDVRLLIPSKGMPVIVYMYLSKGWYNCYSSLEQLLRREYNDDYSIHFQCIESYIVDSEDGQAETEAFLIEKFITNTKTKSK